MTPDATDADGISLKSLLLLNRELHHGDPRGAPMRGLVGTGASCAFNPLQSIVPCLGAWMSWFGL